MNLPRYYEDPSALHIGTEADRCSYIPYADAEEALSTAQEASSRLMSLNGPWNFRYFNSHWEVGDGYIQEPLKQEWDSIPVPGVWQNFGYDRHMYSSCRYPIPFDPPYVPYANPCGLYMRRLFLEKRDGMRYYLVFEGVDSCLYLFVNGRLLGYSQVSHSTSEFDVTEALTDGDNVIVAAVLKWCDGTYLETQDKLRMSGIFRDVYLLTRPENHVRTYRVVTSVEEEGRLASVSLQYELRGETEVSCRLLTPDGRDIQGRCEKGKAFFSVPDPLLWNAENPVLYSLLLSTPDETILQRVGIRQVRIQNQRLELNGVPIRLHGVNRHDVDPFTGFAVTREQGRKDLRLMKEHNINAIRASHYPNAPWFVDMCDEYGFYLIDEADVESHGCLPIYKGSPEKTFGLLAADPRFAKAILDRVQRLVIRDQNAACVLFWSLGNESGYGANFEEAARWVRRYDPTRLLHYECVDRNLKMGLEADTSLVDVSSHMYMPTEAIEEYFEKGEDPRPYLLCEYAHAMGNSPGDLEDYFQIMERYPGMIGAFVWEWCDQAVYMGKAENGEDRFAYGGDFDVFPDDGNFCLDGLVYPDRRPSTGLLEYKNVHRPVRARYTDGMLEFTNYLSFTSPSAVLCVSYALYVDGICRKRGRIDLQGLEPLGTLRVPFPCEIPEDGDECALNLQYVQTLATPLVEAGHLLGQDQILLVKKARRPEELATDGTTELTLTDTEAVVRGNRFAYTFDLRSGVLSDMVYEDTRLMEKPAGFNIWRAFTDNERLLKKDIEDAGYTRAYTRTLSFTSSREKGRVLLDFALAMVSPCVQRIMDLAVRYTVDAEGRIRMEVQGKRNTEMPALPRFGLRFFLRRDMDRAEYFGYGPYESYIDKHQASSKGIFRTSADTNDEPYIRPQENGAHYDCAYIRVSQANGFGLRFTADCGLSFNISRYTQEELMAKRHHWELQDSGHTVLTVDYRNSGIGSHSCGPALKARYQLLEPEFSYSMQMRPEKRM